MEQIVRVKETYSNGMAQVIHLRESACSGDCHKCSGCGAAKETILIDAYNGVNARVGDLVVVKSETGPVMKAVGVFYALPLVLFFLGYLAGYLLQIPEAVVACAGFALGIACVVLYDRKVARKEKIIYTITGFSRSKSGEN